MFYVLGLAVCLAVLFLAAAAATACSTLVWRLCGKRLSFASAGVRNSLLLLIRLFPALVAIGFTLGFAVPAYLRFEPPSSNEPIGLPFMAFAVLGAALLLGLCWRMLRILWTTWLLELHWKRHAQPAEGAGLEGVFQLASDKQLIAAAGILRPQIYISRSVAEALSPAELAAAIEHERAHIRRFDNLKQLFLKTTRPPRWMKSLCEVEQVWHGYAEVAADREAVAAGASALDLSAALVKVCRMRQARVAEMALASHLVPRDGGSAVEARITQLRDMIDDPKTTNHAGTRNSLRLPAILALGLAVYVLCLHAALPAVHEALEILVR